MSATRVAQGFSPATPARQLAAFLARFSPEVAALARATRATLRKRLPRAVEMVYDNYNALVIGYSPTERPSDAILSIAVYPRWVNVFFLQGAHLSDPDRLLQGSGSQVRHIRLEGSTALLDARSVRALLTEAIALADAPFAGRHRLVIRAVSKTQRRRR
jgi:hypothetical protein